MFDIILYIWDSYNENIVALHEVKSVVKKIHSLICKAYWQNKTIDNLIKLIVYDEAKRVRNNKKTSSSREEEKWENSIRACATDKHIHTHIWSRFIQLTQLCRLKLHCCTFSFKIIHCIACGFVYLHSFFLFTEIYIHIHNVMVCNICHVWSYHVH